MNQSTSRPVVYYPDRQDIAIAEIIDWIEGTDCDEWSVALQGIADILGGHGYDVYTIEDELQDQQEGRPRRKKTCRHGED